MQKGTVFNIQKFCINDGPGIRTTVFLKGCPLNCAWCHNPESKSAKPELLYDASKCTLCGRCAAACPANCHTFENNTHIFHREACLACGACAEACFTNALELAGKARSVDEVLAEVLKDKLFYENSNGGMTLSGGEPLLQFDFTLALLESAKKAGLHTAIETCGYAPEAHIRAAAAYVDLFLFDWKLTDPALHQEYTGVSNARIEANLRLLNDLGSDIILRCPIIPTVNDTDHHFAGIARIANELPHVLEVQIEPYHPLGNGKAEKLGKESPLPELGIPENDTVNDWISRIQQLTEKTVKKA